jgi:hypothetical protein
MKMVLGFFTGIGVCLLLVFTIAHFTSAVSADSSSTSSSNGTDLSGLIPNIGAIYDEALGAPYRQVESEITDPDIARYFQTYMAATGLDKIGATPTTTTAPTLYSIMVYETSLSNLVVGFTERFTAIGTYSDGSMADVTSQVTWVSSDPTIAAISSTDLATGLTAGTTYITATMPGVTSLPVTLTVVSP